VEVTIFAGKGQLETDVLLVRLICPPVVSVTEGYREIFHDDVQLESRRRGVRSRRRRRQQSIEKGVRFNLKLTRRTRNLGLKTKGARAAIVFLFRLIVPSDQATNLIPTKELFRRYR
jgi:hypothetical protein